MTISVHLGKKRKDGKCRIFLLVRDGKKRREIPIGYPIYEHEWMGNPLKGWVKGHRVLNNTIDLEIQKVKDASLVVNSADKLLKAVKGDSDNVFEWLEKQYSMAEKEGRTGEAKNIRKNKNTLIRFTGELRFNDIDIDWINEFDRWLRIEPNTEGRRYATTTIGKFHKDISKYLTRKGISPNPYDLFKIKIGTAKETGYLTKEQVNKIEGLKLNGLLDRVRDLFLMQIYLGGHNVRDVLLLSHLSVSNGRIYFTRGKLREEHKKQHSVKITPKISKIIDKYAGAKYLLPFVDENLEDTKAIYNNCSSWNAKVNYYLKDLGSLVGVKGLKTKMARTTVNNLLIEGNTEEWLRTQILGNTKEVNRKHYTAQHITFQDEALAKAFNS